MEHVTIHLLTLRNAEYLQYLKDYLTIIDNNDPALLKVGSQYSALASKADQLEAVLKQDTGSPITVEIEALDQRRDSHLGGLYTTIYGMCSHFDPAMKAAALLVRDRLEVYGNATQIAMMSLQGETATIDNMIYDLQTIPALSAALTTLGLSAWIADLKVVNTEFNAKYIARTEALAAVNPDKIKELRIAANALYYTLRDMLMAQGMVIEYVAPFPKTISEVNALTEQYNHTLDTRAGWVSSGDDEEAPVVPPIPEG